MLGGHNHRNDHSRNDRSYSVCINRNHSVMVRGMARETDYHILLDAGFSEQEIAEMSPRARARRLAEAQPDEHRPPDATLDRALDDAIVATNISDVEMTTSPAEPPCASSKTPNRNIRTKLLSGSVGAIVLYAIIHVGPVKEDAPLEVPGWGNLSRCSPLISFDGSRYLTLSKNHFARLEGKKDARKTENGQWSFDQEAKSYSITVENQTTIYSAIIPGDELTCILIKGDRASVDLAASWFQDHGNDEDAPDAGIQYDR
jgi:hypothetical protein